MGNTIHGIWGMRHGYEVLGIVFLISLGGIFPVAAQQSVEQNPSVPLPSTEPLDLSLLEDSVASKKAGAISDDTISQTELTIPSLWWADRQFGGKLLNSWLAYPSDEQIPGRVDLVVNRQIWSLLDYLERYEFVNHLGMVARDFRYNTRVFNPQGELLAAYTCDFSKLEAVCNIILDSSGRGRLRGQ